MKRVLCAILLALLPCGGLQAQVIIVNDSMFRGRMSEIKATVRDSLTNEPVGFASVYLIPAKDTVITNFTLTDLYGDATLDEVPFGRYGFHVEMMGYKPFIKDCYYRKEHEKMDTILLQRDELFLQAATITDIGNPMVIKKDTVVFNASSFRTGANAMLKDLLQRMPGMEILADGKVKFNGEAIDRITVGGRTFFFDDQSAALNNLPAAIVDKIHVIDRESESARTTGVQDGSKEKVMDVVLKKEYEKGWFGNVGLTGGSTIRGKENRDLRDDRGFLYSNNALISAYGEKDQAVVIANLQNINNTADIVQDGDGETARLSQGLSTAAQLGANVNTSRIKGVETTVSANYKYSDTDSGSRTARTAWQEDGNYDSMEDYTGKLLANAFSANLELVKEQGKVLFHIRPEFRYSRAESLMNGSSRNLLEDKEVNNSDYSNSTFKAVKQASFVSYFTFRDLWGKGGRNLRIDLKGQSGDNRGNREEHTGLTVAGVTDTRLMRYVSKGNSSYIGTTIRYTEPLGKKLTLTTAVSFDDACAQRNRDAYDAEGINVSYSSASHIKTVNQTYSLSAQYQLKELTWFTLGAWLNGMLNETVSQSFGIASTTGQDAWSWHITPTINFQRLTEKARFTFELSGSSHKPEDSEMVPVLDISDPSRLSVGNIYLRPYGSASFLATWNQNNRKRFSSLMVWMSGNLVTNPICYARWYDTDGISISVPVNARKPSFNSSLTTNYTTPLDKKQYWSLIIGVSASLSSVSNYLRQEVMAGPDQDRFDYSAFMKAFWGNGSGDVFYGGKSGFSENTTFSLVPTGVITIKYNQDPFFFSAGASSTRRTIRYSLNPGISLNTMETSLKGRCSYTSPHDFVFDTDIAFVFYKGYPEGYGLPEWKWNAVVSKSINAFNLSFVFRDILNQTRTLTHTVMANYTEDSYRLAPGRQILFGVKWNFGKMNATHSQRARSAQWEMAW